MKEVLKNEISQKEVIIFSDGSCHTQHKNGGWAAIILFNKNEILLKGEELNTTHNRMELLSAIKAFEYIEKQNLHHHKIIIKSDSQYLVRLIERKEKFIASKFLTKKGTEIRNKDLVKEVLYFIELLNPEFVKVKAHQKKSSIRNINREVDKISRKIVREYIKNKEIL